MANLCALLIGIDDYDDRCRNGIRYPKLGGCVRDIHNMYAFLHEEMEVPADKIIIMTAPLPSAGTAQGATPTYTNMVTAFRLAHTMALASGDHLYIHYSGHGGRATTAYPDVKLGFMFDETLVPMDIGAASGQYLRDVEIHMLIQQMVDDGVKLTLVFDSCHSGGATRREAFARGISDIDAGERPHSSLVADEETLASKWRASQIATRNTSLTYNWLLEPKGYTFLAACRPDEAAYEYDFTAGKRSGALTHYLLEALRRSDANSTWRTVMDSVIGCVHGTFAEQSPMLQGEGDRVLFGGEMRFRKRGVRVLRVHPDSHQVRLQAGEAQGIAPGALFDIYPYGANMEEPIARIAEALVTRVGAVECDAAITKYTGTTSVAAGAMAVVRGATNVTLQRPVRIVLEDNLHREAVEQAIADHGKGFVIVADAREAATFQIAQVANSECWQIEDPADKPISGVPPLDSTEPSAPRILVDRLVHLARFRQIQELTPADYAATSLVQLELVNPPENGRSPIYGVGDRVKVRVTNMLPPSSWGESESVLNVTMFDLASDWSITQIYPANGDFETIYAGESRTIEIEAYLPEGIAETTDIIKVFATRDATSFRWMELPKLDQPEYGRRDIVRSASDPLGALVAQWEGNEAGTRHLRLTSSKGAEWSVAQVEVRVQKTALNP